MTRYDLFTFYIPIVVTVLLAGSFAISTRDRQTAFRRGLFGSLVLLTCYHFIKGLVDTANNPDSREVEFLWAGASGLLLGLSLGGLVGLAVGYAARYKVGTRRRY